MQLPSEITGVIPVCEFTEKNDTDRLPFPEYEIDKLFFKEPQGDTEPQKNIVIQDEDDVIPELTRVETGSEYESSDEESKL